MKWVFSGFLACVALVVGIMYSKQNTPKVDINSSWQVISDPTRSKGDDEYDIIVVGGGFGGLSAGALLAKNGYTILLVERSEEVGGLCSGYKKNGFHFSYGAEDIAGLWERGPIEYLLNQVSFQKTHFFVPNTRRIIIGDSFLDIGAFPDSMEKALVKKFPAEEKGLNAFFFKAKKVYHEIFDEEMIRKWGVVLPTNFLQKAMSKKWNENYRTSHRNLIEWSQKTYQEVLDEYFNDSSLKMALCSFLGYLGAQPAWTPASTVVYSNFGYFLYGGYHSLNNSEHFANELASYIKKHYGTVLKNTEVDSIIIGSDGVEGVRVGKKIYKAPIVVSNVNAQVTYLDLIEKQFLEPNFRASIEQFPLGASCFTLHMAVPSTLSDYPSLIQDKDTQTYITISSQNDSSLAPEGWSAVVLRTSARFSDFFGFSSQEQEALIRKRSAELLGRAKALMPELSEGEVIRVLTPLNFEKIGNIPQGTLLWLEGSGKAKRPSYKSPIKGLYLASASSEGAGVEFVIRNGILCAQDIMGWAPK